MTPIRLIGRAQRIYACEQIMQAPDGWVMTLREPTRSTEQNAKLWAMLGDVSKAAPRGLRYTAEEWKCIFMNACGWDVQFLPGLDGRPFPAVFRSSKMTVQQMADLITFIQAWGDENHVPWSGPGPYEVTQ